VRGSKTRGRSQPQGTRALQRVQGQACATNGVGKENTGRGFKKKAEVPRTGRGANIAITKHKNLKTWRGPLQTMVEQAGKRAEECKLPVAQRNAH